MNEAIAETAKAVRCALGSNQRTARLAILIIIVMIVWAILH
ncbi:hypothetical protein [Actinoplanes sp. URMC 104]